MEEMLRVVKPIMYGDVPAQEVEIVIESILEDFAGGRKIKLATECVGPAYP